MNITYLHPESTIKPPRERLFSWAQKWLAVIGRSGSALVLAIVALATIFTVMPARPTTAAVFLGQLIDLDQFGWGRAGTLILALLLVVVAQALVRGKRHAWWVAVGLCTFSIISTLLSREHINYLPAIAGLLVGLLVLAPLFPARSDPQRLRRGYAALALSLFFLLCHGLVHEFWHRSITHDVLHLSHSSVFLLLIGLRIMIFLFLGYGVVEILRPVLTAHKTKQADITHAHEIVQTYGTQSMAHFTLIGAGKNYFFSPTHQSFLAYHLAHGVALVLGDPIGPDDEIEPLLLAFLVHCKQQDWQFALYQASPQLQQRCRSWNLHGYKVGEEAIISTAQFTLKGKIGAPVRHSITRAKRDGISVQCWQSEPLPEPLYLGMQRITIAWMTLHKTQMQLGFSMGRFPEDWSQNLLTVVAMDQQNCLQAFVTWTPLYAGNGWSLDNMRRLADTTPGIMEMLIAESIQWAQQRGYSTMSLGLVPLSGLDGTLECELQSAAKDSNPSGVVAHWQQPSSWLERCMGFLHRHKLLLGSYSSLHFFKNKFNPSWEPRYLIVREPSALPRVLMALAQAHGYTWRTIWQESGLPGLFSAGRQRRQPQDGADGTQTTLARMPTTPTVNPMPDLQAGAELAIVAATSQSVPSDDNPTN